MFKLSRMISPPSIAVDLGTANTRMYASQVGEVTEMPSLISLTGGTTQVLADEYLEYTNRQLATKPLRCGVIVDLKNATNLLRPLVQKTRKFLRGPITLASAPTDTTENERDLLRTALMHAGAAHVSIIPEVWAAAIGAGLDLTHDKAHLLIDMGDGVTDMAVFRKGRMVFSSSIRIACSDLKRAVRAAVMAKYKMQIDDQEAERLTQDVSAILLNQGGMGGSWSVTGFDIVKRRKVEVVVQGKDVITALEPVLQKIIKMIEAGLKRLPERIHAEIVESGIWLTGGGACIQGMDLLLRQRTNLEVRVAADPLHAVINGAIQTLLYWHGKKNWWENISWPRSAN
jgi:rod shape-determining protein MreB